MIQFCTFVVTEVSDSGCPMVVVVVARGAGLAGELEEELRESGGARATVGEEKTSL